MNARFELEEMSTENRCSVLDKELNIRCIWEKGKFNETQEIITEPGFVATAIEMAKAMRELGDWIAENYRELV